MESNLKAKDISAGGLFSTSLLEVPEFQREYSWNLVEVGDFFEDLQKSIGGGEYFLGLIILSGEGPRKQVVDGQQRLLTLTLLASRLHELAQKHGRVGLADNIRSNFLTALDYNNDQRVRRIVLADRDDDATLQALVGTDPTETGKRWVCADGGLDRESPEEDERALATKLVKASERLLRLLQSDIEPNPYERLGQWVEFITEKLFFVTFSHDNPANAYRVFEVVNNRGKGLTTADLMKNMVLSQSKPDRRADLYRQWQDIAKPLNAIGDNVFVQFIRHVVTLRAGHILSRDLYDYVSKELEVGDASGSSHLTVDELLAIFTANFPLYQQMIDPASEGPADAQMLRIFDAFNDLAIISIRPLLLAIYDSPNPLEGMDRLLRLVVQRVVVGNLGTGNVERRLSDAAFRTAQDGKWEPALRELEDLAPTRDDFHSRAIARSFSRGTLSFLRRSQAQGVTTPTREGFLHLVRPRQAGGWEEFPSDEFTYWGNTLGNTVLLNTERRPSGLGSWSEFSARIEALSSNIEKEMLDLSLNSWSAEKVERRGQRLASDLARVWFE